MFAACMAMSVAHLVAMEVFHVIDMMLGTGGFTAGGVRSMVAMLWMVGVIYVTIEVIWTMKPRSRSDEYTTAKPLRAEIAVGSPIIRRNIVVAIWAYWSGADVDADLRLSFRRCYADTKSNSCS